MISIEERREAARRLREIELMRLPDSDSEMKAIHEAVGCWFGQPHFDQEVTDRLADLIEPSEPKVKCVAEVKIDGEQLEKLAHDAAVELTGIDRDALLELADEFEDTANELLELVGEAGDDIRPYISNSAEGALSYARRIREACGEGER